MPSDLLNWALPYVLVNLQCPFHIFHSIVHNLPNKDEWILNALWEWHFGQIFERSKQLRARCISFAPTDSTYTLVKFGEFNLGTYLVNPDGFDWHSPNDSFPYRAPKQYHLSVNLWTAKLAELDHIISICIWMEQQLCGATEFGWAKVEPRSDRMGWDVVPDTTRVRTLLGKRIFLDGKSFLFPKLRISCRSIFWNARPYCGLKFEWMEYFINISHPNTFWFYPNFVPCNNDPGGPSTSKDEFIRIFKATLIALLEQAKNR